MSEDYIPSEKKLTKNTTIDVFEEIYTNHDVTTSNPFDYQFMYPLKWLEDYSQNKRIAVRRLRITPKPIWFKLKINSSAQLYSFVDVEVECNATLEHNLLKVLAYITAETEKVAYNSITRQLRFNYNQDDNSLSIKAVVYKHNSKEIKGEKNLAYTPFKIEGTTDNFLKFLNQELTDENRDLLTTESLEKKFYNVWNREEIFFHASFSTSHRKIIGANGDFYSDLNHLYPAPTNDSTFGIWFSSDGKTPLKLLHYNFYVQLSFISNYMNTLAF